VTELETWCAENSRNLKDTLFLVDYEFLGSQVTGLDLIESLKIQGRSILVTSRYDEKALRERCDRLGIKLIPKSIAGFVPLAVHGSEAILIDDDRLIHDLWKSAAQDCNKRITTFFSVDDFIIECPNFPTDTPIYIDSNLGNGKRGEDLASQIRDMGFLPGVVAESDVHPLALERSPGVLKATYTRSPR
jgi:hypothetical protein